MVSGRKYFVSSMKFIFIKLKIEQVCETSPEVRNILKSINKEKPGRPPLGK